jgi:uncharacterized protein
MDVTPLIRKGQQVIQAYAGGVFKVSGRSYDTPVIVYPETTEIWTLPAGATIDTLDIAHFAPIILKRGEIDVILLGCGAQMKFLSAPLKAALRAENLHVEVMATGAACRTYNVLMAEGRRVAAILLPA